MLHTRPLFETSACSMNRSSLLTRDAAIWKLILYRCASSESENDCITRAIPTAMAPPTWTSNPYVQQCGGQFPAQFVCARGATCISLASDYSATLCCPAGQSCEIVAPISCDTQLWDLTTTPRSDYHSLNPVDLSSCGDLCCPLSYTCDSSNSCRKPSAQEMALASNSDNAQQGQQTTTTTEAGSQRTTLSTPTRAVTSVATTSSSVAAAGKTNAEHDSLNITTKALVSVLAALVLCILIALVWRCITRRQALSQQIDTHPKSTYRISQYSKVELDGVFKRPQPSIQELNAVRTPGELSPAGSIYHGRYAPRHLRLPREVPTAYLARPQSINSEKRELDAWSLNGWRSPPKFEWD